MKKIPKIKIILFTGLLSTLILNTGCASKEKGCFEKDSNGNCISQMKNRKDILTKPYQLKITPLIGSRQEDSKVIMNMGKILKVWIANYKHDGVFVSSHDNFVVAKKPDFVLGEEVPQKNWKSIKTPQSPIPFLFRSADLDGVNTLQSKDIIEYNNNIYKQENDSNVAENKIREANQYDEEIKRFLKEK